METKELQTLSKQKSPYRRPLRRPKPPAPSPGSPAQRAAKSILKLKEGLMHVDTTKWSSDIQDDAALPPQQNVHQPINGSNVWSPSKSGNSFVPMRSPSPKRVNTPIRSPNRKKKRQPTREEHELAEQQDRLAVWLNANPDTNPISIFQASRNGDVPIDAIPPYSIEVESRIESAMQRHTPLEMGVRLWDDPVRSILAAEMTSESIFGGASPTRSLAFQPPEPTSPLRLSQRVEVSSSPLSSNHKPQSDSIDNFLEAEQPLDEETTNVIDSLAPESQLSVHAQKVFDTAHRQVADGAVADALSTLEAGIRQSLSNSQAHQDAANRSLGTGFNYSTLAHKSATKLQLYYRTRHHQRINRLVLLQRQWRWWHARRRMLSSVQFANNQAIAIQRCYKSWHTYITQLRSAVRIQRCFRVFKIQKFLSRFRHVCRLLMARIARRRQVKSRIRVMGKIVFLFQRRRRRISLIQGLWRRHRAKTQLATLLDHEKSVEGGRRAREDEFVADKLVHARLHFRQFLRTTKRGCALVRWQAEKPWLHFRRLRHDVTAWDELPLVEKIESTANILSDREFRGLRERALCQMLVGKTQQVSPLPKVLKVSTKELEFLINTSTDSIDPNVNNAVREKLKRIHTKLSRRAATLWWTLVTYPVEYCTARIWPIQKRRRDRARQQLEDDFTRVLTAFLRVWFRRFDSKTNTPPYSCEWCSEPFATSHEFFAHDHCATARERAETEWKALRSDLQFAHRMKWRFLKRPQQDPMRTNHYAFDLEAASVRRLRYSRSNRKALRPLVATLEACAGDKPNAVIPLDLAAFVLQYLDKDKTSHALMQTAEYQLIRWKTLVGSMEVETSMQSPRDSGLESRWIRKDELRSRLIVGMEWRSRWSRWRRNLTRRFSKYQLNSSRFGSCSHIATKWKELQVRARQLVSGRGARTSQAMPTSPPAT
ncbi:hypothetical protein PHMEG_0001616 [Phytophthora megakarya]|uniref:Uncharacterized protein n=1 Tax=Phytophthora megakarya TaxID=4795 RepID=A0A225X0P3_9STRA|nr:hypothetical protein PHMEG_0001616 [Phytophthora megakarya]